MEGQNTSPMQKRQLAVFDDWNAAQKAKQMLQNANLSLQSIDINGDINPYEEVAAMGTTVGAQAGLFVGAFLGGVLGLIIYSIYSTQLYGDLVVNPFNQLFVAAFTIAGALFGLIAGKRIRSAELPKQKQVGNPSIPRRFQLMVEGSPENLSKAGEMLLGNPAS